MESLFVGVRVEVELKESFDIFCERCGMTVSGAVNLMVKKAIDTQTIPFEISVCEPIGAYQGGAVQEKRINVRIEDEYREAFKAVCDSVGISMSRIIKLYMLRCLSMGKIPF